MSPLSHEFTVSLTASPARVFRALTDERELMTWFAEHVAIEPCAGGEYRFWGRHTPGAPTRSQATQKILRIEPPRLLEFSWPMEESASVVTLELTEEKSGAANGAVLTGRHHFGEGLATPRAADLVQDLWAGNIANLRAHLHGGSLYRPDFSHPIPRVRLSVLIDAPRDKVFQALIEPAQLARWLGGAAPVVEAQLGGRYVWEWKRTGCAAPVRGGPTKILELVEDTKLVTDWCGRAEAPAQRVTWVFESVMHRTRVILIHEPFERTADLADYPHGWTTLLNRLKSLMETG